MSSRFINTCLNNMNPDLACLVRVTTVHLMQEPFEEFCTQIRELNASGDFTSFLFKPKQEIMLSTPQQHWLQCLCIPKGPNGAALIIIGARLGRS